MSKDFMADARAATSKVSQLAKLAGDITPPAPTPAPAAAAGPAADPGKRPRVKTRHISYACSEETDEALRLLAWGERRSLNAVLDAAVAALLTSRARDIDRFRAMLNS